MPLSDYNYLATGKLASHVHTISGVTNAAQAAVHISDAEKVIDAYLGGAPRFYTDLTGTTSAGVASGATAFPSDVFGNRRPDYWAKGGVYVEITDVPSGATTLVGQSRQVSASTDNQVTLVSGFDELVPQGSEFMYHQRSAVPRRWDQDRFGSPRMPDLLEVATAWQVEFAINDGSEAFGLSDTALASEPTLGVQSRTYGSGYSESRVPGMRQGLAAFVAPKARLLLQRLRSATGYLRG